MSGVARRTILGVAGAAGAGASLTPALPAAAQGHHAGPTAADTHPTGDNRGAQDTAGQAASESEAAQRAVRRLLPEHHEQIRLTVRRDEREAAAERFRVSGRPGRLQVFGTSGATALTGLHWYLKYTCHSQISWSGQQLRLPARLPAPAKEHERRATVAHRFVLNDTHDGYTAPYADWQHWERFLDVLALHGFNEILVTAGQEAVYHRLLKDFGYSDAEARGWIPAPSHQPWWLLQNMSEYGGPVSSELVERRTALGRRILERIRELGMRPVLPGYFGTVPEDFADRNPGGRTVEQGTWGGLPRPAWLDPRTKVFRTVAASFYAHQRELFGVADRFKMDLLHEGGDPGDVPVPEASRAVERALQTARPGAGWLILGWQDNPRSDLLEGLAHPERMLIVDGLSDLEGDFDREEKWGGVPYAFGSIPNFGGRTTIGAKTHNWGERFTAARDKDGSKLVGTCYMPEATHRDPAAAELFSELAWRPEPVRRDEWFRGYARLRYGSEDAHAARAMAVLRDTAYLIESPDGRPHDSVFAARPSLRARSGTQYAVNTPAYDLPTFDRALGELLGVAQDVRDSDAYRYDVTDLARQTLANRSRLLIAQLDAAYERGDRATFGALAELWLKLMRLSEEVTGAHPAFQLGPWLDAARRSAAEPAERRRLEWTARTLLTSWADRSSAEEGSLANYANRDWQGLVGDVHLPRWQAYLDELADALDAGREPREFDWYARTEKWRRQRNEYPLRPVSEAYASARKVRDTLARAPYQGSLTVTTDPPSVSPGGTGTIKLVFRNENGFRRTGRTDFALRELPNAEPQDSMSAPTVPPGDRAQVRWRVSVPDEELTEPLRKQRYAAEVRYGPAGSNRVTARSEHNLWIAGALPSGVRTNTTNDAVFGHLDGRYAINGAGADLWKTTAEFGVLYRPGALAADGSMTVRVDSQDATADWARAGLVARTDLADEEAGGFLNLAVTPEHGVALSYDSDGDGTLDRYEAVEGVRTPVLLRLSRDGNSCTGELSTDDGGSWRAVGTARVAGVTGRLDAGLFMSAASGGSERRGTVHFSDWRTE